MRARDYRVNWNGQQVTVGTRDACERLIAECGTPANCWIEFRDNETGEWFRLKARKGTK